MPRPESKASRISGVYCRLVTRWRTGGGLLRDVAIRLTISTARFHGSGLTTLLAHSPRKASHCVSDHLTLGDDVLAALADFTGRRRFQRPENPEGLAWLPGGDEVWLSVTADIARIRLRGDAIRRVTLRLHSQYWMALQALSCDGRV